MPYNISADILSAPCLLLAELCTAMALYLIADRDNDIEIIIFNPIVFTVCDSCQGILYNRILSQFLVHQHNCI